MGGLNADWLTQLAPAHAPPAPGWGPPAPGWWGLALALGLIVAALAYRHRRPAACAAPRCANLGGWNEDRTTTSAWPANWNG
jgi:hypothetical protein